MTGKRSKSEPQSVSFICDIKRWSNSKVIIVPAEFANLLDMDVGDIVKATVARLDR